MSKKHTKMPGEELGLPGADGSPSSATPSTPEASSNLSPDGGDRQQQQQQQWTQPSGGVAPRGRSWSSPVASFPSPSLQQLSLGPPTDADEDVNSEVDGLLSQSERVPRRTVIGLARNDTDAVVEDLSAAYPLRLQRSASSAFGSPASGRFKPPLRSFSNSGNSDPGASAFHPVWSQKSLSISTSGSVHSGSEVGSAVSSTAAASVITHPALRSLSDPTSDLGAHKKQSPWKKVMARMKGRGGRSGFRRQLSGRENPARPALSEDEGSPMNEPAQAAWQPRGGDQGPAAARSGAHVVRKAPAMAEKDKGALDSRAPEQENEGGKASEQKKEERKAAEQKQEAWVKSSPEKQYEDPAIALDLSDSNDEDDDDTIQPIPIRAGGYGPWKEVGHSLAPARPPSVDVTQRRGAERLRSGGDELDGLEAVEVVSTLSSLRVFTPALGALAEGEGAPPDATGAQAGDAAAWAPAQLRYRSPQQTPQPLLPFSGASLPMSACTLHDSPGSKLSSSAGSPTSRVSSSNSRATHLTTLSSGGRTVDTLQTDGSLVADYADSEVREANRRYPGRMRPGSSVGVGGQEVVAGPDGNDTVLSTSTTSSTYHAYLSSPRPLRDGATLPTDRFFAGSTGTLYPSPTRDRPPSTGPIGATQRISRIIALSPKKWSPRAHGAHSPHTVSSNSVSANSSSSGDTKTPLKFVAYESQEDREASPYDEPPLRSSVLRPRISKGVRLAPPPTSARRVVRPLLKPPPSPRREDTGGHLAAGARTPPPVAFSGSGAITPCSPPVIVDGPCGDLGMQPRRPCVVRRGSATQGRGGRGMFLMPPSSPYGRGQHRQVHPRSSVVLASAGGVAVSPSLRGNLTVVGEGTNDGAQEIVLDAAATATAKGGVRLEATAVSPDRHVNSVRKLYEPSPESKEGHVLGDAVVISPDKGY